MTPRQSKLLQAIIREFIDTAEAVGSVNLANKYRLGVSPATIRNEMAELVDQGYLKKNHTSSGRQPTNLGFKHFVDMVFDNLSELDVRTSSRIYEDLFQMRFDRDDLIYHAVHELARISKNVGLVMLGSRLYYAGLANIASHPEYGDLELLQKLLSIVEDRRLLSQMFSRHRGDRHVKVLIGNDSGFGNFGNAAVVFSDIRLHNGDSGYLAVVGPNRMNYTKVIPLVDFMSTSLNKVVSGW